MKQARHRLVLVHPGGADRSTAVDLLAAKLLAFGSPLAVGLPRPLERAAGSHRLSSVALHLDCVACLHACRGSPLVGALAELARQPVRRFASSPTAYDDVGTAVRIPLAVPLRRGGGSRRGRADCLRSERRGHRNGDRDKAERQEAGRREGMFHRAGDDIAAPFTKLNSSASIQADGRQLVEIRRPAGPRCAARRRRSR